MWMSEESVKRLRKKITEDVIRQLRKDEDVIKDTCLQLVTDIFNDGANVKLRRVEPHWAGRYEGIKTVKGKFIKEALDTVRTEITKISEDQSNQLILGEDFIDKLVERLKAKQLT
jgi:hypothetical protein